MARPGASWSGSHILGTSGSSSMANTLPLQFRILASSPVASTQDDRNAKCSQDVYSCACADNRGMRSLDAHLEDLASSQWWAGRGSDGPCCPWCRGQRVNRPNWQRSSDHPVHITRTIGQQNKRYVCFRYVDLAFKAYFSVFVTWFPIQLVVTVQVNHWATIWIDKGIQITETWFPVQLVVTVQN
jgi:hypothetical protein